MVGKLTDRLGRIKEMVITERKIGPKFVRFVLTLGSIIAFISAIAYSIILHIYEGILVSFIVLAIFAGLYWLAKWLAKNTDKPDQPSEKE